MYRKCSSSVLLVRPAEMVRLSVFRNTAVCSNFVSYSQYFENCKKQRMNHFHQLRGTDFFLRSQEFAQYQLIKFFIFILFKKKSATHSCPEPDESSARCPILLILTSILMLLFHLRLGLASSIFPSCIWITIFFAYLGSFMLAKCPPISFPFIWSP
jgi:hypothetical protein